MAVAHLFRRYRRDTGAVALIEFALVLPVMLTLLLGSVEIAQILAVKRKMSIAANTVADLISQSASLDKAQLKDISAITPPIMFPFNDKKLNLNIFAYGPGSNKKKWSWKSNTSFPPSSAALKAKSNSQYAKDKGVILAQANFQYTPFLTYIIRSDIDLSTYYIYVPRVSDEVECSDC